MKTIVRLLILCGSIAAVLGQGTFQFGVKLTTVPPFESTPAMEYTGNGQFTLTGSILNGTLLYTPLENQLFNRIENAAGQPLFSPTKEMDLAPETFYGAIWTDVQLTDTQVNELLAGEWRINVGSVDYPGGALRGQISVVPEPSASLLMILGGGLVGLCALRNRKRIDALSPNNAAK